MSQEEFNNRTDLTELQVEFMEWLIDPDSKGTQNEWARERDLTPQVLSQWRRTKKFREAIRVRFESINSDPVEIAQVLAVLKKTAITRGDSKSASLWLQATGNFTPAKEVRKTEKTVRDMTDDELESTVEDELARRRAQKEQSA